jgi:peptidoglycan/xylan/chitin deacetylase (PgdA/CDA1 family)
MDRTRSALRAVVDRGLAVPGVGRAAVARAGSWGRGLTLIWHRVGPHGAAAHEVVRTVAVDAFEAQLEVLGQLGDIVPLAELAARPTGDRPRFALTFDDDDAGHTRWTLPVLRERGLPATFFLSGRWRDDAGPYWWELLEARVAVEGVDRVAADLGLPRGVDPPRLAAMLFGSEHARRWRVEAQGGGAPMTATEARQLAAAGMEIGFHTRHHDVLTLLDDAALDAALTQGRDEVASDVGARLERFAYPHGLADARVAAAAARVGYTGAWTTTKRLASRHEPAMLRGRWDLGNEPIARFRARIVHALVRPPS